MSKQRNRVLSLPTLVCLVLGAATLVAYRSVAGFEFINIDDDVYVTANRYVLQGLSGSAVCWAFANFTAGFWQPLTWLSHMADVQLFGLHAGAHHLTTVLFHLANTCLLFLLLRRSTAALWRSAVVAALFALHPLHVEAVAWVAERKEVLSVFFGFLSLLFYIRYSEQTGQERKDLENRSPQAARQGLLSPFRGPGAYYFAALALFAFGLMSKTAIVTLPLLMLLLDWWPLQRFPDRISRSTVWPLLAEKWPFFGLALVAGLVTIWAERRIGALPSLGAVPLMNRLANAPVAGARYLFQTVWPVGLAFPYLHPGKLPWLAVVLAVAFLAALSALAVWSPRRRPWLLAGWLWFTLTLLPVIGVIQISSHSRADRYTYLPLIGIFLILAWLGRELWLWARLPKALAGFLAALILAGCLWRTTVQLSYWQNSGTLFRHALSATENNFIAYHHLGLYLAEAGRTEEAVESYRNALRIYPDYVQARNNLGVALVKLGRGREAIDEFQVVLHQDPNPADTLANLGYALAAEGQVAEAIDYYEAALRLQPDLATAHNNLGNALSDLGKTDEAIQHYRLALESRPNDVKARNNLAIALAQKGQIDEALEHLRAALRFKPDYALARNTLGNLMVLRGQYQDALAEYQTALRLAPAYAEAENNLGFALLKLDRTEEAIRHLREALRLNTNYAVAYFNLGCALGRLGQPQDAAARFREALRIQPDYPAAKEQLQKLGLSQ